jgi:DNA integrity scanning protein DisA with diadenylate cyclase activity
VRATDVVDVLLVSAVLFALLSWLRRSLPRDVARRSLAGAPLAGGVYALSRALDLPLLEQVLAWLFVAVLVAAVVVYQADLRRMLERAFARRSDSPGDALIDVLVEAAERLAAGRYGALIALRGREPWPAHVHGGVELGGRASVPLLCSLFDSHTPGHDGAVLIEGDTISRFATHLPLAVDAPDVSRFGGTRHAAALGLAQECDALVIVVSEERGVISVARNGSLTELDDAPALKAVIARFSERVSGQGGGDTAPGGRHPHLLTAAASIGLTLALWLVLVYSPDTIQRRFEVPIAIRNLPEGWTVLDPIPDTVQVDLAGAEARLGEIDRESLAMAVDLSQPTDGVQSVALGEENLTLPAAVELRRVSPAVLSLEVRRARTVDVPVAVPTVGAPPEGRAVAGIQVVPGTVSLLVPADTPVPERVLTEVLDLRRVSGAASVAGRLVVPAGTRLVDASHADVRIAVTLGPARRAR